MFFTSQALLDIPGITHGFGTKEEPIPESLLGLWEERRPQWKQVHGKASCEVLSPGQACGEVDGLFTFATGAPIAVVTADCVPVLFAHKGGRGVAAIHAGWRGTQAHFVREVWKQLAAKGERPENWIAAIGPAIGPCCYEVSEELAQTFLKDFAWVSPKVVLPRPRHLNLAGINAAELESLGFSEVDLIEACTRCAGGPNSPLFHSYRREGGGTRQYSLIMRTERA